MRSTTGSMIFIFSSAAMRGQSLSALLPMYVSQPVRKCFRPSHQRSVTLCATFCSGWNEIFTPERARSKYMSTEQKDLWGVRNGCCSNTSRRGATLWPMMLPARGSPPLEVLATTWDQEGRAAATIQGDSGVWRTVRYSEGPTETSAPLSMPLTSEDNQWGPGRESLSMSAMISPSANVAPMFLSFQ